MAVCMDGMRVLREVQETGTVGISSVSQLKNQVIMSTGIRTTDEGRCNILRARRYDVTVQHPLRINVITSTNKTEFDKSKNIVKILLTDDSAKWKATIAKESAIQNLISQNTLTEKNRKHIVKQFCSYPPPFVNQEYGISLDEYIKFIQEFIKNTIITTAKVAEKYHTDKCAALADTFIHLKEGIAKIKASADEDVIL